MGADQFMENGKGKDVMDAFQKAVDQAAYEHGHGGYSGSLAEKRSYVEITPLEGVAPEEYAALVLYEAWQFMMDEEWDAKTERYVCPPFNKEKLHPRSLEAFNKYNLSAPGRLSKVLKDYQSIYDKWGPAGAIKINEKEWCFFGWASS